MCIRDRVEPAGIDLVGNKLLVSDHATGLIHVYDISSPVSYTHLAMPVTENVMVLVAPVFFCPTQRQV